MDVGIHYASFSFPGWETSLVDRLVDTARVADEGGAAWFTVMDHWFQMESLGGPEAPMLEGYTTLGHLSAVTSRVHLGLLVTGVAYRHPGLLAKTVTTLDVLSRGRAMLGIGASWYEREAVGLGVPFPPLAERFERLEETLDICTRMWLGDTSPYAGRHYELKEPVNVPPPVQRPHPPIVVGGSGERKTLRLVATYADACNLFATDPDGVRRKLEVLRRHCDDVGRDYASIRKTLIGTFDPVADADGFVRQMAAYADAGISLVTLMPAGDDPVAWTERVCGDVIPRLGQL